MRYFFFLLAVFFGEMGELSMNDWVGVLNIAFSWSENSHGRKLNANVSIMTNTNLRSWDLCTVRRRDHRLCFLGCRIAWAKVSSQPRI